MTGISIGFQRHLSAPTSTLRPSGVRRPEGIDRPRRMTDAQPGSVVRGLRGAGLAVVAAGVLNHSTRMIASGLLLANFGTSYQLGRTVADERKRMRSDTVPMPVDGEIEVDVSSWEAGVAGARWDSEVEAEVRHWPASLEPVDHFPGLRGDEPDAPAVLRTVRWQLAA